MIETNQAAGCGPKSPSEPPAERDIMSQWPADADTPRVSILCHAFNHAPYIRDALNGILMQETRFPFEIILHDDASTDGTADIVRDYQARYPTIIRAVLQRENQYSRGVDPALTTIPLTRGSWVAVCEGDDYWIDPKKLARQIEALERHPECKLCFHPAYRVECATGYSVTIGIYSPDQEAVVPVPEMIRKAKGTIPTAALLLRKDVALEFCAFREARPYLTVGDLYLHILGSLDAGALYLGAVMSVYRMLTPGSWSEGYERNLTFQLRHTESRLQSFDELDELTGHRFSDAFRAANAQFVGATLKNPRLDRETRKRFLSRHAPRLDSADKLLFFLVTYVPGALSVARVGHRYLRARRS